LLLGASVVVAAAAAWMTNPQPHPVVRLEMLLCSPLLEQESNNMYQSMVDI